MWYWLILFYMSELGWGEGQMEQAAWGWDAVVVWSGEGLTASSRLAAIQPKPWERGKRKN